MSEACIFCRIIAGNAESSIIYEDDLVLAFLDLRQFHPGHTLVIPRAHVPDIFAVEDSALAGALLSAVAHVSRAIRRVLEPDGINVWQSNGAAAGQEVFHLHLHVLPRYEGDGLLRFYPSPHANPSRPDLDALASRLRDS